MFLLAFFSHYFFGFTVFLLSVFLILLVLVQRGRGGGLTGALGGAGGQSAFGTKAGDLFTRITIGVATVWIFLCGAAVFSLREGELPETGGGVTAEVNPVGGAASGIGGPTTPSSGTTEPGSTAPVDPKTFGGAEQPGAPAKETGEGRKSDSPAVTIPADGGPTGAPTTPAPTAPATTNATTNTPVPTPPATSSSSSSAAASPTTNPSSSTAPESANNAEPANSGAPAAGAPPSPPGPAGGSSVPPKAEIEKAP